MTSNAPVGDLLLEVAGGAVTELVLCAPFAKVAVVEKVLGVTPLGVSIDLITRWRPDEVAAGVSDVGVFPLIQARGGCVRLHDQLHAKYYRTQDRTVCGSANLTATALGWRTPENLELLTEVHLSVVDPLEERLIRESILATQELADEVRRIAEALAPRSAQPPIGANVADIEWTPALRDPADLYTAYRHGADRLSTASSAAAVRDLSALELPLGLEREQFYALVGHRLLQNTVIREVDQYLSVPRRFGEVRDLLAAKLDVERVIADVQWQTLMRWLLEFRPQTYAREVPSWSEVIHKVQEPS